MMPSSQQYIARLLDDPHPVLAEWFAARSGSDGPVQHLATLSMYSQRTAYPLSIAIEEADLEERCRLVSDTLNLFTGCVTVLGDATAAGLKQHCLEQVVISTNRLLDEGWLISAAGTTPGLQRAVGTWERKPELLDITFPKVVVLLDTDSRDTTYPAWQRIIRCRMDISPQQVRHRTRARLVAFSPTRSASDAEWKEKSEAIATLFNSVPTTHKVIFPTLEQYLPDLCPEVLPSRAEQLFRLAANLALMRSNTREVLAGNLIGTRQDLFDARELLKAARVVEDRRIMSDQTTEFLAILGVIKPRLQHSGWTLKSLCELLHSVGEQEWNALQKSLLPPRAIRRHWQERTIHRRLVELKDFGVLKSRTEGKSYLWEFTESGKDWLVPRSTFDLFRIGPTPSDNVTAP
jgi:hypothetical protein